MSIGDTATDRIALLEKMLLIREFEETVKTLFADGELPGFVHLYSGEEAVATGACEALADDDYITSTHRGHGHALAKGLDPKRMMAELYGKAAGYCGGKGGSMHIADVESGMLGANGIVGGGVPIATGAALSSQYQGEDRVALSFFGDSAIAAGQTHEAINFGATFDYPAIYVIENNQYGEFRHYSEQHNIDDLSEAAAAYGIPGVSVDGMDVEAVYEAVSRARDRAAAGDGPTLIEARTYRYHGHHEGDPQNYKPDEEVEAWQEKDPIDQYKARLLEAGDLTDAEFAELEAAVAERIEMAVEFGRDAAEPTVDAAYRDNYQDDPADIEYFRRPRPDSAGGDSQ